MVAERKPFKPVKDDLVDIPEYVCEEYSRLTYLAFKRGDKDRAHAAVEKCFKTAEELNAQEISIHNFVDTALPMWISDPLEAANILTFFQLAAYSEEELRIDIPRVGDKAISLIQKELKKRGESLRTEPLE